MRNPNGYGSVVKLSGKRRNPFMVRKTKGWNEKGHPIYNIIGYFPTRKEAMLKLAEYNTNPYDIEASNITVSELYHKLLELKENTLGNSTKLSLKTTYNNHIEQLKNMAYKDVRSYHIQQAISNCSGGSTTKTKIKVFFTHLDKLALELDIVNKTYSQLVNVKGEPPKKKKSLFTAEEIDLLKKQPRSLIRDYALILLYTGLRTSELLEIKKENIYIDEGYFIAGKKTKAGMDRIIPIHSCIMPFFIDAYQSDKNRPFYMSQDLFNHYWDNEFKKLNLKHTRHECRHTFRTLLDKKTNDKVSINKIMGHSSGNVGEDIYTHKSLEELKNVIELLE